MSFGITLFLFLLRYSPSFAFPKRTGFDEWAVRASTPVRVLCSVYTRRLARIYVEAYANICKRWTTMVIHLNRIFAQPVASICLSLCNYRFSMKLLYVQASAPICADLSY